VEAKMKKIATIVLMLMMLVGCGKEQTVEHPLQKDVQKSDSAEKIKNDDIQKQVDANNTKIDVPLFVKSTRFMLEKDTNESSISDTNQVPLLQEEKQNITNNSESNYILTNSRDEQIPSNRAPNSSNLQYHALWPRLLQLGEYGYEFNININIFDHYALVTRSAIIGSERHSGGNKTVSLYDIDSDKFIWHKKIDIFEVIVPGKIIMYTFQGDKANQKYFIDFLTGQELWATKNITIFYSDGTYFTGSQGERKIIGLISTGEIIVSDASTYLTDEKPIVVKKRMFQDDNGEEHIWDYDNTYTPDQRLLFNKVDNKLLVASNFYGSDYLFNLKMIDTISGEIDWILIADLNFSRISDYKTLNIEKDGDYYWIFIIGRTEDHEAFFLRVNKNGDAYELNVKYKFINYYKEKIILLDDNHIDVYKTDSQKVKTLAKSDTNYLAYNSKVCAGKIFLFTKSLTCFDGATLEELWEKKFDTEINEYFTDIIVSDKIYTIIRRYAVDKQFKNKSELFELNPANGDTINKIIFDNPGNSQTAKPSIFSTQYSLVINSQHGLHVFKDKSKQKAIRPISRFIGEFIDCSDLLSQNEKYTLENTTDRDILVTQKIFSSYYYNDDEMVYKIMVPAKKKIDIPLNQFKQLSREGLYKIVISFENDFDQVMIDGGRRCGD
jgi:PBP1b-binding outer membrane lipoprotein LpoB